MAEKALQFCRHSGCDNLTDKSYCPEHMAEYEERQKAWKERAEKRRPSARQRGYDTRWQKYAHTYLRQPGHQICRLNLPGCTLAATCVDHIVPPSGPKVPLFWDKSNHQPACSHCNSVKGHRTIKGEFELG